MSSSGSTKANSLDNEVKAEADALMKQWLNNIDQDRKEQESDSEDIDFPPVQKVGSPIKNKQNKASGYINDVREFGSTEEDEPVKVKKIKTKKRKNRGVSFNLTASQNETTLKNTMLPSKKKKKKILKNDENDFDLDSQIQSTISKFEDDYEFPPHIRTSPGTPTKMSMMYSPQDRFAYHSPSTTLSSKTLSPNGKREFSTILATDMKTIEMMNELETERDMLSYRQQIHRDMINQPTGSRTAPEGSGRIWKSSGADEANDDEEIDYGSDDSELMELLKNVDEMNNATTTLQQQLGITVEKKKKKKRKKPSKVEDLVITNQPQKKEKPTSISHKKMKGTRVLKGKTKMKNSLGSSTDFSKASVVPLSPLKAQVKAIPKPLRPKKHKHHKKSKLVDADKELMISSESPSSTKHIPYIPTTTLKGTVPISSPTRTPTSAKKNTSFNNSGFINMTLDLNDTDQKQQQKKKKRKKRSSSEQRHLKSKKSSSSKRVRPSSAVKSPSKQDIYVKMSPKRDTTSDTISKSARRSHLHPTDTEFSKTIKESLFQDTKKINAIIKNHMNQQATPQKPRIQRKLFQLDDMGPSQEVDAIRKEEDMVDALEVKLNELKTKLEQERNERFTLKEQLEDIKLAEKKAALDTMTRRKNLEKRKLQEKRLDLLLRKQALSRKRQLFLRWKTQVMARRQVNLAKLKDFQYRRRWHKKLVVFKAWHQMILTKREHEREHRLQAALQHKKKQYEMADRFRKIQLVSTYLLSWNIATKLAIQKRKAKAKSTMYKRKMENLMDRLEHEFMQTPSEGTSSTPRSPHSRSPPRLSPKEHAPPPEVIKKKSPATKKRVRRTTSAEPKEHSKARQMVSKMEERAREREERRQKLKEKYAAIKKAEQEAKEAAEKAEQEAALQAKKDAIRERKAKKAAEKARAEARVAEKRRMKELTLKARRHYKHTLLRKYIFGSLRKYSTYLHSSESSIREIRQKTLCSFMFYHWKKRLDFILASQRSQQFDAFLLKLKMILFGRPVFQAWLSRFRDDQASIRQVTLLRHSHTKSFFFHRWIHSYSVHHANRLKHEAFIEKKSIYLSRRFTLRTFLYRWIHYVKELKLNRKREQESTKLHSEVDGWLKEFRMDNKIDDIWDF